MSSTFLRGKTFWINVPTATGWIKRSTGTSDKTVANGMKRMLQDLGPKGKRAWPFLNAIAANTLSVGALFDAYTNGELDALSDRLHDVDLEPYVEAWLSVVGSQVVQDTREHYDLYVRSLIPKGVRFPRSEFTHERIVTWLSTRPVGPSTRRKYHAALSGFSEHLKSVGVLQRNPLREIKAPRPSAARRRYLDMPDIQRLIAALPEPYRTLSTLIHGTGMEVSVALGLKRRDFNPQRKEVQARGTKTSSRDRIAKVADWAWPAVENHMALMTANAPLFPGINRWTASDKHREACRALEIEDYQLKDSRHSYAVRAIRAGAPFEVVAQQLGHADTTMVVRIYGRFKPSEQEMTGWERIAAAQEAHASAKSSA